jgi:hypothetical protein
MQCGSAVCRFKEVAQMLPGGLPAAVSTSAGGSWCAAAAAPVARLASTAAPSASALFSRKAACSCSCSLPRLRLRSLCPAIATALAPGAAAGPSAAAASETSDTWPAAAEAAGLGDGPAPAVGVAALGLLACPAAAWRGPRSCFAAGPAGASSGLLARAAPAAAAMAAAAASFSASSEREGFTRPAAPAAP